MPRAKPGAGLRRFARKSLGRARIDDLRRAILDQGLHVREIAYKTGIAPRREMPRSARHRLATFERMAFALPLRQAAVQHAYVLHSHDAEGPPHACGAEQSGRIVDDDARAVADAHAPHA